MVPGVTKGIAFFGASTQSLFLIVPTRFHFFQLFKKNTSEFWQVWKTAKQYEKVAPWTLALLRKFWGILTGARKSGENRPESQKDCAMSASFWMWQDEFGKGKSLIWSGYVMPWKPCRRKHEEKHQCWGFFFPSFPSAGAVCSINIRQQNSMCVSHCGCLAGWWLAGWGVAGAY